MNKKVSVVSAALSAVALLAGGTALALSTMPAGVSASVTAKAPVVGSPAPSFTGKTAAGETISLSDFAGKTLVLEWTNHDCPFVRKHYNSNNMQTLQRRAAANDVVWISIISSAPGEQGNVDPATAQKLTTDRNAAPAHVVLDPNGEIGRAYAAKTTPHMFVIDGDQVLQYAGAIDSIPTASVADIARADNYVDAAMTALAGGSSIVTRQSQPYGCSVKYGPAA